MMELWYWPINVLWCTAVIMIFDAWRRRNYEKKLEERVAAGVAAARQRDKDMEEAYDKFKRDYEMVPIHRHPRCEADNLSCKYPEPHKHGFSCDSSCTVCAKRCPEDCPAHDSKIEKVVILDKTYPNGKRIKIEAEGIPKYLTRPHLKQDIELTSDGARVTVVKREEL